MTAATATASPSPADQPARDSIRSNLTETLFVEAGAGTGKTTALVGRIIALIEAGYEVPHIAAITFTEKAATELQNRVRQELQEVILRESASADSSDAPANSPGNPANSPENPANSPENPANSPGNPATNPASRAAQFQTALDELDAAPICTLHSFAQRILSEYALEASLPLRFNMLDEIDSEIQFLEEWEDFQTTALHQPEHLPALQLGKELGISQPELKLIAKQFRDNWDLIATLGNQNLSASDLQLPGNSELAQIKDFLLAAKSSYDSGAKSAKTDRHLAAAMDQKLPQLLAELELLSRADPSTTEFVKLLLECCAANKMPSESLKPASLEKLTPTERDLRLAIRDEAPQQLANYLQRYLEAVVAYIMAMLADFTLEKVAERKTSGQLIFHDLLVLCLKLLTHPQHGAKVRAGLSHRYQLILIDEFQDTDPIQIELVSLIASGTELADTAGRAEPAAAEATDSPAPTPSWSNLPVSPGRLFFVGDPKQSIYRFRRANISLYLQAARHYSHNVYLQANWRSANPILAWVNHVFAQLIEEQAGSQPPYSPLDGRREPASQDPGPTVALLGAAAHPQDDRIKVDELRDLEADELAKLVGVIIGDGWQVSLKRPDADGNSTRPARLSDICVLSPKRSNFTSLERAFEKFRIPYQVQVSNNIFVSPEIRDLFALLKSIDDPTDEFSIVTALRSTAFGCGDDELFEFHQLGGRWDYRQELPAGISSSHPVAVSLGWLHQLHQQSNLLSPSQVIETIIGQRNLLELALAGNNHRDVWRRLGFVGDLARKFSEREAGTLRQFINSLQHLGQNQINLKEDIVPEADFDAVKIMTIHASKGLEFPIVMLANSASQLTRSPQKADIVWNDQNELGFYLKQNHWTHTYEDFANENQQRERAEAIRLLYVACTRARDHLVVSLHRNEAASQPDTANAKTQGALLAAALFGSDSYDPTAPNPLAVALSDLPDPGDMFSQATAQPAANELSFDAWQAQTSKIQSASQRRRVWSPSSIAQDANLSANLDLSDFDPDTTAESKDLDEAAPRDSSVGRSATKVGSAVHAVLQTFDLRSLANVNDHPNAKAQISQALTSLANAQTENFGIHDQAGKAEVKELAELALESDCVRLASQAETVWKEVYLSTALEFGSTGNQLAAGLSASSQQANNQASGAGPPPNALLLDGCIDLAFRERDGGITIVDYKTDTTKNQELFDNKLKQYQLQIAAYALAVEQTTGESVNRCVLLFIPRGKHSFLPTWREVPLEGERLLAAKSHVEQFLREHAADTTA